MTNELTAHEQFLELSAQLSDKEFADAVVSAASERYADRWRCMAAILVALQDEWPAADADYLDAAALVAASHRAFVDRAPYLRNLLLFVAAQSDIAHQLGGEPRRVLDHIEQSLMNRTRLQGEAIRAIWDEPMLQARDAATALGSEPTNRERVRQLRLRSELLGLRHGRGYLYPAFQFDPERRCVDTTVGAVNQHLRAGDDPWGVASWWFSVNDRLNARPCELVAADRDDDLLAVANAITEPVG